MWDVLIKVVDQYSEGMYTPRLLGIREESVTTLTYGPSVRDFIDNHGQAIRTAGSPEEINLAITQCSCSTKFPDYIDPKIGHVRTMDVGILKFPFCELAASGLNYRPAIKSSSAQQVKYVADWLRQVVGYLSPHGNLATAMVEDALSKMGSIKACTGLSSSCLDAGATSIKLRLVTTSTDKAPNTPSIECLHWYRFVCLQRLQSAAFQPCNWAETWAYNAALVEHWSQLLWSEDKEFKPSILFCSAKQHKRDKDSMAYRYITNACSDHSAAVAQVTLDVLTHLWGLARELCIKHGETQGGKFWWTIDSLDVIPLNVHFKRVRPDRQLSAHDLEKCYETIPLLDGPHSLKARMSTFLDIVWVKSALGDKALGYDEKEKVFKFFNIGTDTLPLQHHTKGSLLDMVCDCITMTMTTVGDFCAKQVHGIPMGSKASVILLNIYRFTYEWDFVWRLVQLAPQHLENTREMYAYIDDILNLSDLSLRDFLNPDQPQEVDNIYWIYPLAPNGPLTMKETTTYHPTHTSVEYLNQSFTLKDGMLSFKWHDKSAEFNFKTMPYTHWHSRISRSCKIGMIYSQARSIALASDSRATFREGIEKLIFKFRSIGFPEKVIKDVVWVHEKYILKALPLRWS